MTDWIWIAAAVSTDDRWIPPSSRDAFFSKAYCNAKVDRIDLTPVVLGVKQIGHMGYFRGHVGEKLWPEILQWLARHGLLLDKWD